MTTKITKVKGLASEWVQSVKSAVGGGLGTAGEFVRKHPATSAVTVGGGVLAGIAVTQIARKKSKSRVKNKKPTSKKRVRKGGARDRKFISKQKHEQAYIKRKKKAGKKITRKTYKTSSTKKSKSRKGIHYTKNGQPYKILSNGRARFIKRRKK